MRSVVVLAATGVAAVTSGCAGTYPVSVGSSYPAGYGQPAYGQSTPVYYQGAPAYYTAPPQVVTQTRYVPVASPSPPAPVVAQPAPRRFQTPGNVTPHSVAAVDSRIDVRTSNPASVAHRDHNHDGIPDRRE